MFYVYVELHGSLVQGSKSRCDSRAKAIAAFTYIVDRTNLDGRGYIVFLKKDKDFIASHDFTSAPGDENYWRGRIADIPLPDGRAAYAVPESKNVMVHLDKTTIDHARILGGGNLSLGLRRAVKMATGV